MPNWVKTNLTFRGSDEDVQKIKELVFTEIKDDVLEFDFNKVVPYPTRENCPEEFKIDESKNITDEFGIHNNEAGIEVIPEHPYLDWWKWNREKWGTKWNACDAKWFCNEVWFDTAWSFCEPVVVELSKQFPNVLIEFKYADENIGSNCDYGWCKDGYITHANLMGEAAVRFALDILGDIESYDFVKGQWIYIG